MPPKTLQKQLAAMQAKLNDPEAPLTDLLEDMDQMRALVTKCLQLVAAVEEFKRAIETGNIYAKGLPSQMFLGNSVEFAKAALAPLKEPS